MSAATEIPVVIGIAALPAALLLGGVAIGVLAVRKYSQSLSPNSRKALDQAISKLPQPSLDVLRPHSLVEREADQRVKLAMPTLGEHQLSTLEQFRVSTLASLAAAPYLIRDGGAVDGRIQALLGAKKMREARSARKELENAVRADHRSVFDSSLAKAASNAMRKISFQDADVVKGAFGNLRVTATDEKGRSLVAEVQYSRNGHPRLAAEVVGVSDGSCHDILDRFEKALNDQGVRYTAPRRVSTGGVCLLDAARDFLRGSEARVKDVAKAVPNAPAGKDERRTQRLNRRKVQAIHESR